MLLLGAGLAPHGCGWRLRRKRKCDASGKALVGDTPQMKDSRSILALASRSTNSFPQLGWRGGCSGVWKPGMSPTAHEDAQPYEGLSEIAQLGVRRKHRHIDPRENPWFSVFEAALCRPSLCCPDRTLMQPSGRVGR